MTQSKAFELAEAAKCGRRSQSGGRDGDTSGVVVRMRGDRLPGVSALGVACWGVSVWAVLGIVWWAVGDLIVGATVTGVYTVGLLGWIWSVHRSAE